MELRKPSAGRLRSFATMPRNLSYVFMTKFCTNSRSSGVNARLLQSHAQIVNHVVAGGPGNGTADQTAHDDDRYAIGNAASAALHYYLVEFCQRLFADHAGADAPEDSNGEENINDHTRAKRQEQKERETTEPTICHDPP